MSETTPSLRCADLDDPLVQDLLRAHAERALSNAQCRVSHALDLDGLRHRSIEVWAIWEGGVPLAVGALRSIDEGHGELKSMFVADVARGRGLGQQLLDGLIEQARSKGLSRLSLETGALRYFDAARRLYSRNGFERCEALAGLSSHPDSVFLSRAI